MENNDEKNRELDSITEEEIYETLTKMDMFSGIELNDTEKNQLTKLIASETFKLVDFLNKDNDVYDYYLSYDGKKQFNGWKRIPPISFVNTYGTIPDEWHDSVKHQSERARINFYRIFKLCEFEKISLYDIYDRYYIHNMKEYENEELSEEKGMLAIFGLANFLISKGIDFKDKTIANVFKSELADSIRDFNDSYENKENSINNKLIQLHDLLYETIKESKEVDKIKVGFFSKEYEMSYNGSFGSFIMVIEKYRFGNRTFRDRLEERIKAFNHVFIKPKNGEVNINKFFEEGFSGDESELLEDIDERLLIPGWDFNDRSKESEFKTHLKRLYSLLVQSYIKFKEIIDIDSKVFDDKMDITKNDLYDSFPFEFRNEREFQKMLYIEMRNLEKIIGIYKNYSDYIRGIHYLNPCGIFKDIIAEGHSFLKNRLYPLDDLANTSKYCKKYQKLISIQETSSTDDALKDYITAERRYQQAASTLLERKKILKSFQKLCYVPTDKETDYGKNFQTINKETSAIGDLEIE